MTYTILFVASYPDIAIGYSKVANFISNTLAAVESVHLVYFGFSNFPGAKKIQRRIDPNITLIDVLQEEQSRNAASYDVYGTNIFVDTINRVKPDLIFIYNDIIVASRLMNTIINYRNDPANPALPPFKVHTYLDLVYDYERPEFLEHVFRNSDKVILFTDYWREHLTKMGFPKEKMSVLYHSYEGGGGGGGSSGQETVEAKRLMGLPTNSFIVLNANRNCYRKAIDITITAFLIFLKDQQMNPAIYLLLRMSLEEAHGYKIRSVIQTECIRLGLDYDAVINHHILTIDRKDELSDERMALLYAACDVGLNTCIGEGFGLCNMEHGIAGKPQIVSKVGGLRDIFEGLTDDTLIEPRASYHISNQNDEHNGIVYVCGAADFAAALKKVYANYALYAEQFAAFSVSAKKKYGVEVVKEQLLQIVAPRSVRATVMELSAELRRLMQNIHGICNLLEKIEGDS
jgi:glycosyltransferase involved in cell wall biosynthesis